MQSFSTQSSTDNNCPTSPTSSLAVLNSPSSSSPENTSKDDPTSPTSSDPHMDDSKPDLAHPRSAIRNPSLRPGKNVSRRVSFNDRVSVRQVPSFDNHPEQCDVQSGFGCSKLFVGWTCWVMGLISFVIVIVWVVYYFVFRHDKKHVSTGKLGIHRKLMMY